MSVKDLFSNKSKYISRKDMRADLRHDPTFQKKILSDQKLKKILRDPVGQKKVHDLFFKKARDGKFDFSDMEGAARELQEGKVRGISRSKGRLIAKEFLPNLNSNRSLIKPKNNDQMGDSTPARTTKIKPKSERKFTSENRYSPRNSTLDYAFAKTGFINSINAATPVPPANNHPSDTKTQVASLINIARKKMLDEKEDDSGDSKGSFSNAMATTMRNKRN